MKEFLRKPPMGWNSWDCYGASVREEEVRQNAAFIAKHLKQYGWEYITVDIQWSEPKAGGTSYRNLAKLCIDEYGRQIPAENRFPSAKGGKGFAPLAEYVHSLGLKFGIHILRGIPREACYLETPVLGTSVTAREVGDARSTCRWNGDMYGVMNTPEGQAYYDSIFSLYAAWGVDLVKVDDLSAPEYRAEEIAMIRRAIDKTGREIVFSASPGDTPLSAAADCVKNLNMWRISDDFWDSWELLQPQFKRLADWNEFLCEGHYPDADMIPIGMLSVRSNDGWNPPRHSRFTGEEEKTLMTLWCIAKSPLILGCETTLMTEAERKLFTNAEVIALDQRGEECRQVSRDAQSVLWRSELAGNVYAAAFNLSDQPIKKCISFAECGAPESVAVNVWSGEAVAVQDGGVWTEIAPHGCVLLRFSPITSC